MKMTLKNNNINIKIIFNKIRAKINKFNKIFNLKKEIMNKILSNNIKILIKQKKENNQKNKYNKRLNIKN